MTDLMEYDELDDNAAKRAEEELKETRQSGNVYRMKQGTHILRFLPARKGEPVYVVVWAHWADKADGKGRARLPCAAKNANKRCPVCERKAALERTGNPSDARYAADLAPSATWVANALVYEHEADGPVRVEMSGGAWQALLLCRDDHGSFTDPTERGYWTKVTREGSGQTDTRWRAAPASKLGLDKVALDDFGEILRAVPNLAHQLALPDKREVTAFEELMPPAPMTLDVRPEQAARPALPQGRPAPRVIDQDDPPPASNAMRGRRASVGDALDADEIPEPGTPRRGSRG